ncbi:hypothetical protein CTAYLR_010570 [Chrysophaeum taylorii]|uniref:Uncharacterized protein n=1 Tax=Chrysophaeum taylorii TaxID=2483200 RepID=A0AAD7XKG0_9STRA|nr:hypothetical protein CTAYLR_010570 [Chrysophaeum taylorii]
MLNTTRSVFWADEDGSVPVAMAVRRMDTVKAIEGKYDNVETTGFDEYLKLAGMPSVVAATMNTFFRTGTMTFKAIDNGMTVTMPTAFSKMTTTWKFGVAVLNKAPDGTPITFTMVTTDNGLEITGVMEKKPQMMPYAITISKPKDGVLYYKCITGPKPVVMTKKLVRAKK